MKYELIELKNIDGTIIKTNRIKVQYFSTRGVLITKEVTAQKLSEMENDPYHYDDLIFYNNNKAYDFEITDYKLKWFGKRLLWTCKVNVLKEV